MKAPLLFLISFLLAANLPAQVINGSFEQNNQPSLEGWDDVCNFGTSEMDAAPGSGQYCLKMLPGQTQGCFPGYFYQVLPDVTDGQIVQISGWAKTLAASPTVGIYLGKVQFSGTVFLMEGDTTSSLEWTSLSVQDTFSLEEGESAAVVINSGLVGGPIGPSHASFFDGITINVVNDVEEQPLPQPKVFPNPVTGPVLYLQDFPAIREVVVYDAVGRMVTAFSTITNEIPVANCPPGWYVLQIQTDRGVFTQRVLVSR